MLEDCAFSAHHNPITLWGVDIAIKVQIDQPGIKGENIFAKWHTPAKICAILFIGKKVLFFRNTLPFSALRCSFI